MPQSEQVAHRLATIRAAREVVPSDPDHSARWHRHGVPSPFSRWNHHPEYEVHLITAGTGWYVVGDRIDVFAAGQLVLVGSNVPHHWISDLAPGERLPERDVVFQFHPQWIDRCADLLPELGHRPRAAARSPGVGSSSSVPPGTRRRHSCRPSAPPKAPLDSPTSSACWACCRTRPRTSGSSWRPSGRRRAAIMPTVPPTASTSPSATSSPTSATRSCGWRTPPATSGCRSPRSPATSPASPG